MDELGFGKEPVMVKLGESEEESDGSQREDKAGVMTSFAFFTTGLCYDLDLRNLNMLNMFTQRRTFLCSKMVEYF